MFVDQTPRSWARSAKEGFSYYELMQTATGLQASMEDAAAASQLPADVAHVSVDRKVYELIGDVR